MRAVSASSRPKKDIVCSYFFSILLFLFLVLYWPSKKPENFSGFYVPGFVSYLIIGISIVFCAALILRGELKFTRHELIFCVLLAATPIPGLIGYAAGGGELVEWRNHVIDDEVADTLLGFRPFLLQTIMFLFCAPVFARYWGAVMRFAVFCALSVHLIWGVAQFLYPVLPMILSKLPILVGGDCTNSSGFCEKIVRAVGLTPNPFFFSFIYFSAAALYISRWRSVGGKFALIISMLSLSRSFIIASIIILISRIRSKGVVFAGVVIAILYGWFGDVIISILLSRFENDSSVDSRSSTNMLALKEVFVNSNVFGIGFNNRYFTDSTFATLMLDGGIFSVLLYLAAWVVLFRKWDLSVDHENKRLVRAFALAFFVLQTLVGSADAQPGGLLFFVAFWIAALEKCRSNNRVHQISRKRGVS